MKVLPTVTDTTGSIIIIEKTSLVQTVARNYRRVTFGEQYA